MALKYTSGNKSYREYSPAHAEGSHTMANAPRVFDTHRKYAYHKRKRQTRIDTANNAQSTRDKIRNQRERDLTSLRNSLVNYASDDQLLQSERSWNAHVNMDDSTWSIQELERNTSTF